MNTKVIDRIKKIIIGVAVAVVVLSSIVGGAISDRLFGYRILDRFFPRSETIPALTSRLILTEESVVIDVVEKAGPSVVTIVIEKEQKEISPFAIEFGPFGLNIPEVETETKQIKENIGTGFIISQDGLIVTNKHVVINKEAKYKVLTKDDKEYEVSKIYRDPVNDLAILKLDGAVNLQPIKMGDSDKLKVGQFVITIGTALGEFKNTVTTGVISGLGRGITAGSAFEGFVERLDNVIQTDAAINPGNSGGPLLNSIGQVIGINVAIAAQGQNISFAIPINTIKEAIENFNRTGKFERAFLGIRYRLISRDIALMNDVPQGVYVVEVISGSAADEADIKVGDIITEFDDQKIREEEKTLAELISKKKIGDTVKLKIWRDGQELEKKVVLQGYVE